MSGPADAAPVRPKPACLDDLQVGDLVAFWQSSPGKPSEAYLYAVQKISGTKRRLISVNNHTFNASGHATATQSCHRPHIAIIDATASASALERRTYNSAKTALNGVLDRLRDLNPAQRKALCDALAPFLAGEQ